MGDSTSNYESFYQGGGSSFNPDYGNFTGFRMSGAQLGFPGSTQTANQLGETVNGIKSGAKAFEVTMLQADMAETIPKQHFSEMKALMKLTGVKPSVHGPMIDPAGFDERGNWGNGIGRADAERRMFDTLEKASMLDSKGSVPVVFHSSAGAPGAEFRPGKKEWGEKGEIMEKGAMINQETGQVSMMKRDFKFRPDSPDTLEKGKHGGPAGVLFSAEGSVGAANRGEWEGSMTEIAQMNKHSEEIMGASHARIRASMPELKPNQLYTAILDKDNTAVVDGRTGQKIADIDPDSTQLRDFNQIKKAGLFLENAELSFNGAFHKAYKYGSDKQKEELRKLSKDYHNKLGNLRGGAFDPMFKQDILDAKVTELGKITEDQWEIRDGRWTRKKDWGTPQIYKESNEFAADKAAETFGNLAKKSYDKLGGDKAPVLAIEAIHPGTALAGTDDMIKLVKKSRKNFARQLIDDEGFSKEEAKRIAAEKIGVTWDVGHINMIKKHGFTDKDVVEQTKKIAPMVKHVHLTDNFGFADTHLAPGMGNVPIKKILEQLEKTGRFDEMRKIVEAPSVVQHFKTSPHPLTLAAFGSPIYGMSSGAGWNQANQIQGSYFGGYGDINPQTHHSYFGAGFTTMPVELGGNMPGGESRFGGTPMN